MTGIRFEHIQKDFGEVAALRDIDFQIGSGELFFLLGPSGCGKSTLLRIIAGLQARTSGRILFGDRDVTNLPTSKREAVMCFQSYALWPHMTVADNVRFALDVRRMPVAEREKRVGDVLRMVQLTSQMERKPNALSGGQQQRAALARALAVSPQCLLLDEPLSNLDAKLRLEMRGEIRRICKTSGLTTVYVTHDQKEALSIADRIALMNDGRIVQIGTPWELYHRPRTRFVADFIGQTNLIEGKVIERNGEHLRVQTRLGVLLAAANGNATNSVCLSIRPEQIRLGEFGEESAATMNRVTAKNVDTVFLGESTEHLVESNGVRLKVLRSLPLPNPPTELVLQFDPDDVVILEE